MQSAGPEAPDDHASATRTWSAALRDEIRSRWLTYVAAVGLTVLGPVAARMIFPEASLSLVIFGGVLLGGFFAFCALANRLFE